MYNIAAEWNARTTAEQLEWIKRAVYKAANSDIGSFALQEHGQDIEDLTHDAWIRVTESLDPEKLTAINSRRAQNGNGPITLKSLVYRSAKNSLRRFIRQDSKLASEDAAPLSYSFESEIITRILIDTFKAGRDEIDKLIMEGKVVGHTEKELATSVQISGPAIHKRIVKLRNGLQEAIA